MNTLNKVVVAMTATLVLAGCGRGITSTPGGAPNLESWTQTIEKAPAPALDPLPVLTKFEPVSYNAEQDRDPFSPQTMQDDAANALRPNANRPKEILEGFALDGLKMVGTIGAGAAMSALIQAPDNVVYRVRVGEYMGQSDGRVVSVSEDRVQVVEVISNGSGGWEEREAAVVLAE
jgi:type IV pilus assembly protein PilP